MRPYKPDGSRPCEEDYQHHASVIIPFDVEYISVVADKIS